MHFLVQLFHILRRNKILVVFAILICCGLLSSRLGEVDLLPASAAAADDVGGVNPSELVFFFFCVIG